MFTVVIRFRSYMARRHHGWIARLTDVDFQSVYIHQSRLGIRCSNHGLRSFLCDLEHDKNSVSQTYSNEHFGKQLHAVDSICCRIFDGRHNRHRIRCIPFDYGQSCSLANSIPWTLITALLGVFLAVPMKRQMINEEKLAFPSGIAAAETLKSLYGQSKEAILQARFLVTALFVGLFVGIIKANTNGKKCFISITQNFRNWFLSPVPFVESIFQRCRDAVLNRASC